MRYGAINHMLCSLFENSVLLTRHPQSYTICYIQDRARADSSSQLSSSSNSRLPALSESSALNDAISSVESSGGGAMEEMAISVETVEESGPVVYSDGEEDEVGLRDADMDELAYEGDPLLYSDYEDEGTVHFMTIVKMLCFFLFRR